MDEDYRYHQTHLEYWKQEYRDRWQELVGAFKWYAKLFISYCPDCHKIRDVLWHGVGNHDDCVPF